MASTSVFDPRADAHWLCLQGRAVSLGFGFLIWTFGTNAFGAPSQLTCHE